MRVAAALLVLGVFAGCIQPETASTDASAHESCGKNDASASIVAKWEIPMTKGTTRGSVPFGVPENTTRLSYVLRGQLEGPSVWTMEHSILAPSGQTVFRSPPSTWSGHGGQFSEEGGPKNIVQPGEHVFVWNATGTVPVIDGVAIAYRCEGARAA